MSRPMARVHIVDGLGLGLAGDSASNPIRQGGSGYGSFFTDARNYWSPAGTLTNDGVGYTVQGTGVNHAGGVIGADFKALACLYKSDGSRQVVGIANGKLWLQDPAVLDWTQKATGLPSGDSWVIEQYGNSLFFVSSSGVMQVWDGTTLRPWMIQSPASAPTVTPAGAGALAAATGWSYLITYLRSSDKFESPTNTTPATTGAFAAKAQVNITNIPGTGQQDVDKINIYRTTDGGGSYRFLAQVANPGSGLFTTYTDTTTDAALGIVECTMITAVDPVLARCVAVMGGQIFVGRITENDGTVFPWRVRWCYPEQPWRFEEFDRTDEVEGELISLRPADKGLVCWTPDRAVALIPIGGGAYAAQRLPWPGAVNPAATCTFNGSVAWVAPAGVFLSGENISNPPTDGGSLGLIVKTIDPTTAWMLFFPRANVLLFGVDKTTTFLYDVARKEWWRVDWGGTCATLVPSLDRYRTAPDSLVVATSNGATVYGMNGFKAAGNPLLPKFKIGPFDFGLDYRKRFRHVELHIDAGNDLDLHIKHEIDGGERAGEDVERLSTPQAKLDVDFVVGVSVMGALTRVRVKSPIGDTGTYLTLTVTETTGGSVLNVQAIDLYFQAAEFVDSQGG